MVIDIALGIVLAVLILAFLPVLLPIAVVLGILAAIIIGVILLWGSQYLTVVLIILTSMTVVGLLTHFNDKYLAHRFVWFQQTPIRRKALAVVKGLLAGVLVIAVLLGIAMYMDCRAGHC